MFDKLLLPILYFITFIAWLLSFIIRSLLWFDKPIKRFGYWWTIKVWWKLNQIHLKIKKHNREDKNV